MDKLTKDSKNRIIQSIKKGFLEKDFYEVFFKKSNNKEDIIESLKTALNINCINISKFWIYIVYNLWGNVKDTYDAKEIMLLKNILDNDGVICRTKIKLAGMNDYMVRTASSSLEEREVLLVVDLESNQKLFMIDPKFKDKVLKNEKE